VVRDIRRLAGHTFDVLVIGGGIYGATAAWEAAHRGLSVALVEASDFGAGTSFHSLKTVHGGLRSLQRGSLAEMREFIRERRALLRIAPHLVHPLPFLVPTYPDPRRGRLVMRAGLTVNDLVASDRNAGLDPARHLPGSRLLGREECLRRFEGLPPASITGGALWHDAQMYSAERLTLAFVASAVGAGAVAANHAEVTGLLRDGDRVIGAEVRDRLGDERLEVRSRVVINAAGAWARAIVERELPGARNPLVPRLSKAMNVVARRAAPPCGLGGLSHGRFFFQVPWRGVAIFGTSHVPYDGDPADALRVTSAEIEPLLADANRAFPAARLGLGDVTLVHRGLLPMTSFDGREVRLAKQSQLRDHRDDGLPGLVSIVGVRYTTARHTAQQAVSMACALLGRTAPPSRTAVTPLAGGDTGPFAAFLERTVAERPPALDARTAEHLGRAYGADASRVMQHVAADPALAAPLGRHCPTTRAEVQHAVRHEMAVTLTDALLRRTEAGAIAHPGDDAAREAAGIMAAALGWDQARVDREIAALDAFYVIHDR
jgi:glycerol-3-phosphate dehydrogenase